jgi:hypothetical protein
MGRVWGRDEKLSIELERRKKNITKYNGIKLYNLAREKLFQ